MKLQEVSFIKKYFLKITGNNLVFLFFSVLSYPSRQTKNQLLIVQRCHIQHGANLRILVFTVEL